MRDDYYPRELDMTSTADELRSLSHEISTNRDDESLVNDEEINENESISS